jgi:L-ribulose-5-phosphate 3-epimerase
VKEVTQVKNFKIGVMVDSFRLKLEDGIKKAAAVGAEGIQIYSTSGEMAPENLSAGRRKEIIDIVRSNGLVISALCGDLGGHGFTRLEDNPWKIEKSKRIMELAKELDTSVVTTHIGVIPEDSNHPGFKIMQEACGKLGEYGEKLGACFAIETGPETAKTLGGFLKSLKTKGVGVNLDPANLVMVTGDDPVAAVHTLKDFIVHTHAKDGIMLKKIQAETVYNFFAEGGIEGINLEECFKEVPLGEGSVDFDKYLAALDVVGFKGFLTIEREVGENPEKDIRKAVEFLKGKLYKG